MKQEEHQIEKTPSSEKTLENQICPRCLGTGLICSCEPEISPGCCCADYANAICPECNGTGKKLLKP
jgi:hypothetical protein